MSTSIIRSLLREAMSRTDRIELPINEHATSDYQLALQDKISEAAKWTIGSSGLAQPAAASLKVEVAAGCHALTCPMRNDSEAEAGQCPLQASEVGVARKGTGSVVIDVTGSDRFLWIP